MAIVEDISYSQLPDNLKEEILKRLPVECLCRSRRVCQHWNALFSSTQFITTQWADFPSNKRPWLVLCDLDSGNRCWAYCFYTKMWKPYFSLSFIKDLYYYRGSTTGLLFVDTLDRPEGSGPFVPHSWIDSVVCNPLTGRSVILPARPSSNRVVAKGIIAGECDGDRQTYKAVVVGQVPTGRNEQLVGEPGARLQSVEIYDSYDKSWSMAMYVPGNVDITGVRLVFCQGYLYCKATFYSGRPVAGRRGIVGLNLQNYSSLFAPYPDLGNGHMSNPLVACGSSVLLAGWVLEDETKILKEVHIWELQKVTVDSHVHASWLEIARMRPLMGEHVSRIWPLERNFKFVGVGDCVCFRGRRSGNVAIYSLIENSWSWLPSCPLQTHRAVSKGTWIYSFEPRPDMKVG